MLKYLSFTLLFLGLCQRDALALALQARAQNPHEDSVKRIAIADARKFRLDKARMKLLRLNRTTWSREYLEPGGPGDRSAVTMSARRRKLGLIEYKHRRELATGYFEPVASAVSDTALLRDSVYVRAYREKALQRTLHRRTFGHYAWVSSAVLGGAEVIGIGVFLIVKLGR